MMLIQIRITLTAADCAHLRAQSWGDPAYGIPAAIARPGLRPQELPALQALPDHPNSNHSVAEGND